MTHINKNKKSHSLAYILYVYEWCVCTIHDMQASNTHRVKVFLFSF